MRWPVRGLYVIIDPAVSAHGDVVWLAREVIAGGAVMVQWRDKVREKGVQLAEVEGVARVCREAGAPFIVNDNVDLALVVGAGGVHVGQRDLPVRAVRSLVPREWIVGASTNNVEEARRAVADGASYVSVGNLFGTRSKDDTRPATLEMLHAVRAAVPVPVCAIGGITESNVGSVIDTGAAMAAVISAVVADPDPRAAARRIAARFEV